MPTLSNGDRYGSATLTRAPEVDEKLNEALVRSLYSTPKAIFGASVVALGVTCIAFYLSNDAAYLAFLAAFLVVGAARILMLERFRRLGNAPLPRIQLRKWEIAALSGAWAFAGLTGLIAAFSTLAYPGAEVEFLTSCCAIGYIAGISSRNASRPLVAIGQISAICIPVLFGLLLMGDVVRLTIAAFITLLFVSAIVMSKSIHENIVMRHRANVELEKAAHYDSLTGLKNRKAFVEQAEALLAQAEKTDRPLALVAVDLDSFKDVNDRLGHGAGDAVLREAARRIAEVIDRPHELSRVGGDEFVIALIGVTLAEVATIAERVCSSLAADFAYGPTVIDCRASVGFAIGPNDGRTYNDLMRSADLALYAAKSAGRGQVCEYSEALREAFEARVELAHDLRSAVSRSELELVYQPVVNHHSKRAICCEALLRWNHATRGPVSPADFIPVAEATGLIVPIGAWVLNTACAEAAKWPEEIKVAVNLSPIQFKRGREIVDTVLGALRDARLQPGRLELEVTESVLIHDNQAALSIVEELRSHGVGVSLDDFGTGFSSLAYLNDFPFTKVKIDRRFSQSVCHSVRTRSIIKGIALLTHDLGMELVAEGIENGDQLNVIAELGVGLVQGYIYSRPLSPTRVREVFDKPFPISEQQRALSETKRSPQRTAA